jgi:hypothetical protein
MQTVLNSPGKKGKTDKKHILVHQRGFLHKKRDCLKKHLTVILL